MKEAHRNHCFVNSNWREVSAEYSRTSEATVWTQAHQWDFDVEVGQATASEIRKGLNLRPRDRVLEVGCGTGTLLQLVLNQGQEGVGLDVCEPLVQQSERFGINKKVVKLAVAEAAHLPIPSNSFDKVFCFSIFHHFPDASYAELAIREMFRVCRPNGKVFIGDVCGIMERRRKLLLRFGVPEFLADAFLWVLKPFKRTIAGRYGRLFYRRSFFRQSFAVLPCEYRFLEPATPGRTTSNWRFNVGIYKHWGLTKAGVLQFLAWFWSAMINTGELSVSL